MPDELIDYIILHELVHTRVKDHSKLFWNELEFAKDVGDDGVIKMTGLTESIAVIAIDKHGNESKAVIL